MMTEISGAVLPSAKEKKTLVINYLSNLTTSVVIFDLFH